MTASLAAGLEVPGPVEGAFAALSTGAWPAALEAHLHDGSLLVSAEPAPDGGTVLVYSRRLPEGGPGVLRRFLPADGRATQRDAWGPARDGRRAATWEVGFPGMPATVGGTMLLEPAGAGTRWSVAGTVKVKVPLVGGQIEAYLAPLLEKLVTKQGEVLRALLAG